MTSLLVAPQRLSKSLLSEFATFQHPAFRTPTPPKPATPIPSAPSAQSHPWQRWRQTLFPRIPLWTWVNRRIDIRGVDASSNHAQKWLCVGRRRPSRGFRAGRDDVGETENRARMPTFGPSVPGGCPCLESLPSGGIAAPEPRYPCQALSHGQLDDPRSGNVVAG